MKCLAAMADGHIACIGYGRNPRCHQHQGCDAICVRHHGDAMEVILVEVKLEKFDPDDVDEALYCHRNIEVVGKHEVVYAVIADTYRMRYASYKGFEKREEIIWL